MIIGVAVHAASVQDRDGAKKVIEKVCFQCPRLEKVWADGGYAGELEKWVESFGFMLEIVRRKATQIGFEVLPKRWIVERTFGWLNRYRRLSKDYEGLPRTSECMIYIAMINLMLHRLAPEPKQHGYAQSCHARAA
jgi:putative transposase